MLGLRMCLQRRFCLVTLRTQSTFVILVATVGKNVLVIVAFPCRNIITLSTLKLLLLALLGFYRRFHLVGRGFPAAVGRGT